jgi:fructose-1,6-bisphosphatase/inositol monophosphatase family enzyme
MPFDNERFLSTAVSAARASCAVICNQLLAGQVIQATTKVFDGTLVTEADHASERAALAILRREFPDVPILREEGGLSDGNEDWIIWIDPLDGTSAFTLRMPTSTVIIAAYHLAEKRLLATVVGEPAYERIWCAGENGPCQFVPLLGNSSPCHVWQGDLSLKSTVFVDISHSFRRKTAGGVTKELLSVQGVQHLFTALIPQTKVLLPGSNGLNHALVANGGQNAAGAITTAMGGPWDVAGVLLVVRAGGACRAFNLEPSRSLTEVDPLDPLAYDFLVCGNNQTTAGVLVDALQRASLAA